MQHLSEIGLVAASYKSEVARVFVSKEVGDGDVTGGGEFTTPDFHKTNSYLSSVFLDKIHTIHRNHGIPAPQLGEYQSISLT